MAQPRSDWLFLTLRGLVLLVLGWAFGALHGLTSLGALALFLPVSSLLLGFPPERASTAGWLATLGACVGAVFVFASHFALQGWVVAMWLAYLGGGFIAHALLRGRARLPLQGYLALVLVAVGTGMVWQAYPTLADGTFRSAEGGWAPLPSESWKILVGSALLAGLVGGATGLGGGYVLVPATVLLGIAPHYALWFSFWLMLPLAVLSSIASSRRRAPSWRQEGWLSAGSFLGGVAGATWATSFSEGMLVVCFGVALALLALVTWRSLSAIGRATSTTGG